MCKRRADKIHGPQDTAKAFGLHLLKGKQENRKSSDYCGVIDHVVKIGSLGRSMSATNSLSVGGNVLCSEFSGHNYYVYILDLWSLHGKGLPKSYQGRFVC